MHRAHNCHNLIKEAKKGKKNFAAVWLDLGNAYGSVPHQLIESAMELYHILEKVQGIVRSYFGGMKIQFTVDDYTTSWQRVEKGIVTGWTKDALKPPIGGFMDIPTVATTTHIQARWVL